MINDASPVAESYADEAVVACGDDLSELEAASWVGFLRAHSKLVRELDDELVTLHGLPLSSYDVLVHLSHASARRLRMSELAEAVLLSRSGLTRLVGRLVDQGLIERVGCEKDARGAYAVLTERGAARLAEARVTHLAGVRARFHDHLDETRQLQLAEAWRRLAAS
ncbi:MAG: MarR family transcriptional regulator [Thermoleophilaceae bacterium]